jgi:hypothetical protein
VVCSRPVAGRADLRLDMDAFCLAMYGLGLNTKGCRCGCRIGQAALSVYGHLVLVRQFQQASCDGGLRDL